MFKDTFRFENHNDTVPAGMQAPVTGLSGNTFVHVKKTGRGDTCTFVHSQAEGGEFFTQALYLLDRGANVRVRVEECGYIAFRTVPHDLRVGSQHIG
jgi:hypothetical protein